MSTAENRPKVQATMTVTKPDGTVSHAETIELDTNHITDEQFSELVATMSTKEN